MKNNFQLSKLAASLAVMGGMSLFSGQLMAAAPLAGTNISNVATASYTDNTRACPHLALHQINMQAM